jgi:hypothetical protein
MTKPVLVAVVGDPGLAWALRRRFGAGYEVVAEADPGAALAMLRRLGQDGRQVALLLADQRLEG